MRAITYLVVLLCTVYSTSGKKETGVVREYFIASVERYWDYAPLKQNTFNNDMSLAKNQMFPGNSRIGSDFKKAIYRQFMDRTFTQEIPSDPVNGYIGPTIKGEVGDVIIVHFKNFGSRPYTVHPQTFVYYEDTYEGALLPDGTSAHEKLDDMVPPGGSWTYKWELRPEFGPTEDDENCIPSPYSSHHKSPRDIESGLVGMMVICKPGTLKPDNTRRDVDREFVLYMDEINEANSWYINKNIQRCGDPILCSILLKKVDPGFLDSLVFNHVNGYIYGNGPEFVVKAGEKVVFYAFGMSSGIHSVTVQGNILTSDTERGEAIGLPPGIAKSISMTPSNPGRWMMGNQNLKTFKHGMIGFVKVLPCKGAVDTTKLSGTIKRYYIAADEVLDSNVPNGIVARAGRLTKTRQSLEEMDKKFEGIRYRFDKKNPTLAGLVANPGEVAFYRFVVPDSNAPNRRRSCFASLYHSSGVGYAEDINYRLTGPLTICKRGRLFCGVNKLNEVDCTMVGFDRQYFIQANAIDTQSDGSGHSKKKYNNNVPLFPALNGKQFGNLQGIEMCLGELVLFQIQGFAGAKDGYQTIIFEGNRIYNKGKWVDAVTVWNGKAEGVVMKPDNVGQWLIKSGHTNYQESGVLTYYIVRDCGCKQSLPQNSSGYLSTLPYQSPQPLRPCGGPLRRYYIGTIEVDWDYAPSKVDPVTLQDLRNPKTDGSLYIREDGKFTGSIYRKAVYRAFTDVTFTKMVPRGFRELHLGLMGPIIRAEVGDTIEIVYKNMVHFPNTINLRNLKADNKMVKEMARGVAPGNTVVYRWTVSDTSGPSRNDPNCVGRSYDSTTNPVKDANSGLLGPLVICKKNVLGKKTGQRTDQVDRELVLNFQTFDENKSHYSFKNAMMRGPRGKGLFNPYFIESYRMRAIDGGLFFNTPGLNITCGENVAWYIISTGCKLSQHSIKFNGQALSQNIHLNTKRVSVISSEAGTYTTAQMEATHPKVWLLSDHEKWNMWRGMKASFTISHDKQP